MKTTLIALAATLLLIFAAAILAAMIFSMGGHIGN